MKSRPRNLLNRLLERITLNIGDLDVGLSDVEVQADLAYGRDDADSPTPAEPRHDHPPTARSLPVEMEL